MLPSRLCGMDPRRQPQWEASRNGNPRMKTIGKALAEKPRFGTLLFGACGSMPPLDVLVGTDAKEHPDGEPLAMYWPTSANWIENDLFKDRPNYDVFKEAVGDEQRVGFYGGPPGKPLDLLAPLQKWGRYAPMTFLKLPHEAPHYPKAVAKLLTHIRHLLPLNPLHLILNLNRDGLDFKMLRSVRYNYIAIYVADGILDLYLIGLERVTAPKNTLLLFPARFWFHLSPEAVTYAVLL